MAKMRAVAAGSRTRRWMPKRTTLVKRRQPWSSRRPSMPWPGRAVRQHHAQQRQRARRHREGDGAGSAEARKPGLTASPIRVITGSTSHPVSRSSATDKRRWWVLAVVLGQP